MQTREVLTIEATDEELLNYYEKNIKPRRVREQSDDPRFNRKYAEGTTEQEKIEDEQRLVELYRELPQWHKEFVSGWMETMLGGLADRTDREGADQHPRQGIRYGLEEERVYGM
jgi:predicted alpha-1,6-mannanase (GH76 family)